MDPYQHYQLWIRTHDTITEADRRAILDHVSLLPAHPLISVVMPTYNTPAPVLAEAIASVEAQLSPTGSCASQTTHRPCRMSRPCSTPPPAAMAASR